MALVGNISGSSQSNSRIGISGSVIIANRPNATFPGFPGLDTTFFVSGSTDGTSMSVFGGNVKVSGSLAANALTGSLTKLSDGSSYLVAGSNITVVSSSSGQVTIGSALGTSGSWWSGGSVGSNNNVLTADGSGGIVAESNLNFDGSTFTVTGNAIVSGDLTVNGTTTSVNTTNVDIKDSIIGLGFSSGTVAVAAGDRGWIGGIAAGTNVMEKWDNTNSEFVFARTTSSSTGSLAISSYANLHVANIQASIVTASLGFSGSLTKLIDGTSYIIAGGNMTVTSASNGAITLATINSGTIDGVTAGTGLKGGGTSGTVTLSIDDSVVATISGSTFTGPVKFNQGLSGSLTKLVDGTSYLIAGSNIGITSASNGAITISNTYAAPSAFYQWNELSPSPRLNTTASVSIAGGLGSSYAAQSAGTDVFFYVSGSISGSTGIDRKSVFGGDLVASGSFSQGNLTFAKGLQSHAEGISTSANGDYSHAEGLSTTASGVASHAEGNGTFATGNRSHAEGYQTHAEGDQSHAEGSRTYSYGSYSHSEGLLTITNTSAQYSHAEGESTQTFGASSHAEGQGSIAYGSYSHAQGIYTIASGSGQNVVGKYNKRSNDFSLFVVGDGTGDSDANRSDILRVNSGAAIGQGSVQVTGSLGVSGSASFDSLGRDVSSLGSDVYFFVSGSIDSNNKSLFGGDVVVSGSILPGLDVTRDLGSSTQRWANIYTGDLHLKNDRGDWTMIEEDDYLSLRNNKTGKLYKLAMTPVE